MCVTVSSVALSDHALLSLRLRLPPRDSRIQGDEEDPGEEGEEEQKRLETKFDRTEDACRDKWVSFLHRAKNKASTHEHTHTSRRAEQINQPFVKLTRIRVCFCCSSLQCLSPLIECCVDVRPHLIESGFGVV